LITATFTVVITALALRYPPLYAALDLSPFATLAAALLAGGGVHAINQYRRTPAEVESISVASLSSALEQLRIEVSWRDQAIDSCRKQIQDQARLIDQLQKQQEGAK
jgi:hypothetical protein